MPLELYRRGKIWHYRGTVAGRRLRGSTKTAIKEAAQQAAIEIEKREWKRHHFGPEAVLTFAQAAISYRAAEKPTRFLDRIEDYWKDTPVRDITGEAVRQSAIQLMPRAKGGAGRNRNVIVPTQAIINHAAKLGHCQPLKVKRFPTATRAKTPATWDWVQRFMAVASPHLGALACFMFLTGARISEALALTWADVDLSERRALIRETKINSERRAHLPRPLVVALANIGGNREPEAKVFGYSSRDTAKPVWRAACKRAGIKPLSYHCCRHGFATSMLHAGVDPLTVARLGGWKDARHVFATYGHARDEDTLADLIAGESGSPVTHLADLEQKRA